MKSIKKQFIKILNFLSVPLQMFGVMVLYFVIEAISRHSVSEAFSYMTERPLVFLYNSFLIFTTTMLVYLVRRRVFMRVLLTIFWLGLGIINGVLLANRVTPFTGPDLHLITDAVKIANKYLNPFFFVIVMIIAILVLIAMIILFVKGPRYRGKLRYRVNIPFVLIVVLAFAGLHLLIRIMDIHTVWQLRFLIPESAVREIILNQQSMKLRTVNQICPKQEKKDQILSFYSWNPFLIRHWLII